MTRVRQIGVIVAIVAGIAGPAAAQGPLLFTTTSPLPSGKVGQSYAITLAAQGGTAPYKWSASGTVPPGLTISTSGLLSGTPTAMGSFSFIIQVTDSAPTPNTTTGVFALTINPASTLAITTVSPLFNGTAGTAYAQTFSASGGTPPYTWAILSGNTGGLTLDANTGALTGVPQNAGTLTFTVQVSDSVHATASQTFSVLINPAQLTITTASTLTNGSVGVAYNQVFSVVGGTAPYTWSFTAGTVPGLTLSSDTGTLSGVPTNPGTFPITIQAKDASGLSASKNFTLTVTPAGLKFTSASQLPDAAVGTPYSQAMSASGGVPPYTWSASGLPDGLTIDPATGVISGTPTTGGSVSFTLRVTDAAMTVVIDLFHINVALPTAPAATITGLPATLKPADQPALQITLSSAYLAPISGQAVLSFAPDSGAGDSTIQFSTGGRTANFAVAAGSTQATFDNATLAISTGTVAGTIMITLRLQSGGLDVTPSPAPTVSAHIDRAAPVIGTIKFTRNATGFTIDVTGYSTGREVTQATFNFTAAAGQTLQTSQFTIPVETIFTQYYQTGAASTFGSQFTMTQPFTVQGDPTAVTLQSVTLTNRTGSTTSSTIQ